MADEEKDDVNEENQGEATEAEDGADGEGEEGEGGKSKLPLIIIGVVVLLLAVGAGLFFTGMLDGVLGKEAECVEEVDDHGEVIHECPEKDQGDGHGDDHGGDDGHGKEDSHAKDDGHGGDDSHGKGDASNFLAIPTMLVNLSGEDGTPRYLRLTVQLELHSPSDYGAVEAIIPRVVDQFQTYLRELRVRDLRGSAGIYRLQMELLWRVNKAAAPTKVKDVLFQEILIQ